MTLNGRDCFGYLANSNGTRDMTVSENNVAVFGNTDLWLANNDGGPSRLLFYEAESDKGVFPSNTHFTSFEAGNQTANIRYILPTAGPTGNGQVLSSDTNGLMSWVNGSGSTGAHSFSNASATTPTMTLENNVSTNNGTALFIAEGATVLSYALGAPASLPVDVSVFAIDNGTGGSAPVVGEPLSGTNGQILYVYVLDPDGATVGGVGGLGGAFYASGSRLTFIYVNGSWRLFHVN